MKVCLSLILLLIIAVGAVAQKPIELPPEDVLRLIVKKQQVVDDFEMQLREIPYAGVRVYIRYKLAEWLWKKGRDDTDRAEGLAVKALEEAFIKKDEIPTSQRNKFVAEILGLLDTNSKETSIKLRAQYDIGIDEDLFSSFSHLTKKGGDQPIAENLLTSLRKSGEVHRMFNPLLNSLRTMKSPQFPVVLGAFLNSVESGRTTVNNGVLYMFFMNFDDPQVSPAFKARYFAMVVARARAALQSPDPEIFPLLSSAITSFGEGSPELLPEAMALKSALTVTENAVARARREAQERINASTDKLAAYLKEAENAEEPPHKSFFYMRAANVAKNSRKLSVAIGIIDKVKEIDESDFGKKWTDQEYTEVAQWAFDKDDVEIARIAIGRVADPMDRVEVLRIAAEYFARKKDLPAARDAIAKTLKLLADTDKENKLRAQGLVSFLPVIQRADKVTLPDAIAVTARAINEFPTPGAEDKVGTKNYTDYVLSTIWLDYNLTIVLRVLFSGNKTDAIDLAERIQRKEVRIAADLVIATDTLDAALREAEKKAAEKLKAAAHRKDDFSFLRSI